MIILNKFQDTTKTHNDEILVFTLALAAALLIKMPTLFGIHLVTHESFYIRNMSLFVLPLLTGYFIWKRQLGVKIIIRLSVAFIAAGIVANSYPFDQASDTEVLLALHLPVALWLIVGIAYAGVRWNQVSGRMEFIRFSGELFIYYVLIALGGGVLSGFMALIFGTIGIDIEPVFESWLLPCGATSAVIVASWLVETRKSITENMASVLARLFTPLFAIILITFLGTMLWSGGGLDIERDVLIAFDMLLLIVLGLLLYCISARDEQSPPSLFDVVQIVLLISALLADGIALWAITERITEFGLTPNRVAALGMNVILLVNLSWSTVLYIGFVGGRRPFGLLVHWQTNYLSVYAVWASIVTVIFPLLFGFG